MNPPQHICNANENEIFVYAALADNINGVVYSDLTGNFPVGSYWGMQYIFIAYIYNENVMHSPILFHRETSCEFTIHHTIDFICYCGIDKNFVLVCVAYMLWWIHIIYL